MNVRPATSSPKAPAAAVVADIDERLLEIAQRSQVKIETNSKGTAQVKIAVCAGETEQEMERLSLLALKIWESTQARVNDAKLA